MSNSENKTVVCYGEVLWDMLPTGKQPGGAPMNVAYHLQQLGKHPTVISKVGFDDLGKQLIETLAAKNIPTDFIQIDHEKPTSVVTATFKNKQEMVYTISEDVAWDYIEKMPNQESIVRHANYFVYGSLAARNRQSFEALLSLLEMANLKTLDLNLRAPFYNRDLLEVLLSSADILKVNRDELELVSGWFSALSAEKEQMQLVKDRFHLQSIMLTRGKAGAILNIADEWHATNGLPIQVEDTIGCGDAFLAAFISKQIENKTIDETLRHANQLAAFIATKKGACPGYELSSVNAWADSLLPNLD
ncbi:carbohydrate kinase family protein [Parapedobacter koreensis]|uniref:Fructokinase n=1 Tax=Parapedobacter koreensis TaxID=332977 RepID=A0A1H7PVT9_9SPHI|nr:carbohydrate kinase [Parapedobacter koreensis]SEL39375.1 fructokinase [Parapedobacter koreensis]